MRLVMIVAAGVVIFLLAIVVTLIVGNWLLRRFRKPTATSQEHRSRARERLLNPKWDEIEAYFGQVIPHQIKQLYNQSKLITATDIVFRDEKGCVWELAQFQPADLEALKAAWPAVNRSKNFPFASDSVGDLFYIPLDGPEKCVVMCFHHDGDDAEVVSNSLEEFLSWHDVS